jgi:hypothetical protein
MKVVALRGVCIGVGRHLQPGDEADLDEGTVQFLSGINAVKVVPPPPEVVPPPPAPPEQPAPAAPVFTEPPKGAKALKKGP